MEEMNARVMENEVMDETVEVDEAVDSGNAGALVAGIVGGFLAYAVIGGAKKLWGFAGAKLAERKAARKAGTDAVDVEYTDVEYFYGVSGGNHDFPAFLPGIKCVQYAAHGSRRRSGSRSLCTGIGVLCSRQSGPLRFSHRSCSFQQ